MANRVLYLFYSEEEIPITRSVCRIARRRPEDLLSCEMVYYPAVWLLRGGDFYRLDFETVGQARTALSAGIFAWKLRKHTTKLIKHDEYLKLLSK